MPTETVNKILGKNVRLAVVMGPSFAHELALHKRTAFDVFATHKLYIAVRKLFVNDQVTLSEKFDYKGMQLIAIMKNIIAFGMGLLEGCGFGENGKAVFATLMIDETKNLLTNLVGTDEALWEISGIGDIFLTSLGSSSRNLKCGRMMGQGLSKDEIIKELGCLPEAFYSICAMDEMARTHDIDIPFTCALAEVIRNNSEETRSVFCEDI